MIALGAALAVAGGCGNGQPSGGCRAGTAGCSCEDGSCDGDLVCDVGECRAAITCADAGCVEHQLCTEAGGGNDAACLLACATGFEWNATTGRCDPLPGNCIDGDPASIEPQCDAENRECVESGGDASCGACKAGFIEIRGVCEEAADCAALGCEGTLNRECDDTANPPQCTDCLPDFAEDPPNAACRALVTCADLTCADCVEHTTTEDAFCPLPDICAEPPACPPGEAWAPRAGGGQCVACPACVANTGQTGNLYPVVSEEGSCICETNLGYYFSDASDAVEPCDEDGDGWTRITARQALRSSDCAVHDNAHCQLRTVDRFVLHADEGVSFDVLLTDDLFTRDLPEVVSNNGRLDLFETVANDTFSARGPAPLTPPFEPYANGNLDAGVFPTRIVEANEVNSLTKACAVTSTVNDKPEDYNDNGEADITEWQGMSSFSAATAEWQKPFVHFSYFIEAHVGWYDGPEGGTGGAGAYHIREKSRANGELPFRYGSGQGSYWAQCYRRQDADYYLDVDGNPSALAPNRGMDFARFPPQDVSVGRMGHHSQLKCVKLVPDLGPNLRAHPEEIDVDDVSSSYVVNECNMELAGSTVEQPGPGADPGNPSTPAISCRTESVPSAGLALVAPLYTDYEQSDDYTLGCINECADQALLPDASAGAGPGYQCPGFGTPGEQCNDDAGDFGIIQCNCDDYHAGIDCDFGCAPPNVFFDPEYHVGEQDSGELWACGHQVASSPSWLAEPTSRFEIRGYVPATAVERRLMCETPPCDQPTAGFAVW